MIEDVYNKISKIKQLCLQKLEDRNEILNEHQRFQLEHFLNSVGECTKKYYPLNLEELYKKNIAIEKILK